MALIPVAAVSAPAGQARVPDGPASWMGREDTKGRQACTVTGSANVNVNVNVNSVCFRCFDGGTP